MAHRWVRRVSGVATGVSAILLLVLTGGFPPWAWRLFFHAVSQLSQLWKLRGPGIVAPFFGVGLLSLTIFVLWGALLAVAGWMAVQWWRARGAEVSLQEEAIAPALYALPEKPEDDDVYEFEFPASRPRDVAAVSSGVPTAPYPAPGAAQNGRQQGPVLPRKSRNVRFDVPLDSGYAGVPTPRLRQRGLRWWIRDSHALAVVRSIWI